MRKKVWIPIIVGIVLAVVGGSLGGIWIAKQKKEEVFNSYAIGVITPFTGHLSYLGEATKQGLELAKDEINQAGGIHGKKIELIYEDTQSEPKTAVTAVNKLISIDKVPVVIGDITSAATLAVAPIVERNKVVLFANGASSPKVREAGDYVFRNWNSDDFEARVMANFAFQKLGLRKAAIIYINDDYGLGLKSAFEKYFQQKGGLIVTSMSYEPDEINFRSHLLKIRGLGIDAVYLVGFPRELGRLVKQSQELKIKTQFLSSVGVESQEFLDLAGEAANGIIFTAPSFNTESSSQLIKEFVVNFKERYGKVPDVVSATSYDALNIVVNAIRDGGYNTKGIKQALYNTKNFPGVSGITTIDEYGDVSKPVSIKVIKNKEFVYYEEPYILNDNNNP